MKTYNFNFMKKIIEQEKNNGLIAVDAGMQEDWNPTAQVIWTKENLYDIDIFSSERIGGIRGSAWATPIMVLYYENGKEMILECFDDDGKKADKQDIEAMKIFAKRTGGGNYKN